MKNNTYFQIHIFPGVRPNGPGVEVEGEPVCEECSQAKNSLHCIDASIQVRNLDLPHLPNNHT